MGKEKINFMDESIGLPRRIRGGISEADEFLRMAKDRKPPDPDLRQVRDLRFSLNWVGNRLKKSVSEEINILEVATEATKCLGTLDQILEKRKKGGE